MKNVVSPNPITAAEVKSFYLERLVPVGQALHMVAEFYDAMRVRMCPIGQFSPRLEFKNVGYQHYAAVLLEEGFSALHLVNCYLQSRLFAEYGRQGDRILMSAMGSVLADMLETLCAPVFVWVDSSSNESVRAASRADMLACPRNLTQLQQSPDRARAIARTTEVEDVILAMRLLSTRLHALLDVTPATRQAWVKEHINPDSPLTKGGKLAAWRTLVNNLPWTGVANALRLPKTPRVTWLGSRPGREQVQTLMDEAFAPSRLDLPTTRPPGDKLPLGVSVTSTADGYLVIEGKVSSRRTEVLEQLKLDNATLSKFAPHLEPWLNQPEARVLAHTVCSFTDLQSGALADVVRNTGRLIKDEIQQEEAIIEELQTISTKLRHAALMAKLNAQFSPEEIAELSTVLGSRS